MYQKELALKQASSDEFMNTSIDTIKSDFIKCQELLAEKQKIASKAVDLVYSFY
jgi:hypothetical protein